MKNIGTIVVDNTHKDIKYKINENGCYEIVSHADRGTGYCVIKINGKVLDIHRWYYQKMTGINLTGLVVRHKCDNRKCINMEHLEHGTQRDNVIDMYLRNRSTAIMKIEDIEIIMLLIDNDISYKKIAKLFNTTYAYISSIARGIIWKQITNYDIVTNKFVAEKQSGEKYIYWSKRKNKWVFDYKTTPRVIKMFKDLEDAIKFKYEYFNN